MRIPTVVLLITAALAMSAGPAAAAVTSAFDFPSRTLTVTGDGEADTITVTCGASSMLINGAPPQSGGNAPCQNAGAVGTLLIDGLGGNDTIDVKGIEGAIAGTVTITGGDGDDQLAGVTLTSNGQTVKLSGGPGADTLTVNASDIAEGGTGDDRIVGPVMDGGTLSGDDGTDTFVFAVPPTSAVSFTFTLSATGMAIGAPGAPTVAMMPFSAIEVADLVLADASETVDARAFPGSVRVEARGGTDTITGSAGADTLNGGEGNDFIDGVGGADTLLAGGGLDLVHARDGIADTVDCGTEDDTLVADPVDAHAACERVDLPAPAAPPADTTAPALGVGRATIRQRRLRVRVSCPATETRCAGVAKLTALGRRGGRAVRIGLGAITFQVDGGKSATLGKRLTRKRVRALKRLRNARLRVALDIVDAAGNRTQDTLRVRLRR
jgi:Ca2+-binding RTX toxin-like protein